VFLQLEGNDVILIDKIVALVRRDGKTAIILRDNTVRGVCFTPMTLNRRAEKSRIAHSRYGRGNIKHG
jgi:hypothetical protein